MHIQYVLHPPTVGMEGLKQMFRLDMKSRNKDDRSPLVKISTY